MNKTVKSISGFLGISMFMFGVLKFVNPFKGWYETQVVASQLPLQGLSYWSGQLGEIVVGMVFIFLVYHAKQLRKYRHLFTVANIGTIVMMVVAFYVHMHPDVPNDVLPLKIKPPVIPLIFAILPALNIYTVSNEISTNYEE
ncbi:MAG: hypothetical protein JXQ90_09970 [Cyclobacteriaceae bacterium]